MVAYGSLWMIMVYHNKVIEKIIVEWKYFTVVDYGWVWLIMVSFFFEWMSIFDHG